MSQNNQHHRFMIERDIVKKLKQLATKFPVVTLTGARQCGKSTLLKNCFGDYTYVSLEDLDYREFATNDPRGFLKNFDRRVIIDEAQYAPKLFSYLQTAVDSANESGMYILSGSHNFLLMEQISQSLAGRTAILKLSPLSLHELKKASLTPRTLNEWLFVGGYPRIYDKNIAATDYFPNYIQTYIERDVRLLRNISNLSQFVRFLKLCAARVGQLLNVSSLANECDITTPTAQAWLSILETSYVVYLLKPYHKNYNKRLIKSPKLYFYDTGLAASLLGLESAEQLSTHYLRGELFENMVVGEYIKKFHAFGREPSLYFWCDSNRNEIDLLVEHGTSLEAIEIKSNATMNRKFFDNLKEFRKLSNLSVQDTSVVYGGDVDFITSDGKFISWRNL